MKRFKTIGSVLALAVVASSTMLLPIPALAKNKEKPAAVNMNRVWPPPPQKARYKLLQIINGEADIVVQKKTGLMSRIVADTNGPTYIRFRRPHGVAGDSQGRLYVSDTYLRTVFAIDPKERTFKIFAADNPDVKFQQPLAVTVDSQDHVWVADAGAHLVNCLTSDGKLISQFGNDPGVGKDKNPILQRPAGLAIDEKRQRVYVSDAKADAIFVFDITGQYLTQFGKPGDGNGELHSPGALLLDKDGQLYVADTMNARVQIFDPELNFVSSVGSRCDHPGCFARPKGLAMDSAGHLYVSDSWFNNVQVFGHDPRDKDPKQLSVLIFLGNGGVKPGDLLGPGELYVNKYDQVFVADQMNGRVQVIQYLGGGDQ